MGKFYCDYCDIYLTHSSTNGRKQHNSGRKHINNKIDYYKNVIKAHGFSAPLLFDSEFNVIGHLGNVKQFILNNSNTQTGEKRSFSSVDMDKDTSNKNIPNKKSNTKQGIGFNSNYQQNNSDRYVNHGRNLNTQGMNNINNKHPSQNNNNRGTRYAKRGFNNSNGNDNGGSSGNNNYQNHGNYNIQNHQPQHNFHNPGQGNNNHGNNQRPNNKHNVMYNNRNDHTRAGNGGFGNDTGRMGNNSNTHNRH